MNSIKNSIKEVPGWPKDQVTFKDISPLLSDPKIFTNVIDSFYSYYREKSFNKIVGVDSRGFLFSSVLAYKLKKGLVLARKKGKLPPPTYSASYELEYGTATLEIGENSLNKNDKVLLVDDVLATGGTIEAVKKIIEKSGAQVVEGAFLMDIRKEIQSTYEASYPIFSIISY